MRTFAIYLTLSILFGAAAPFAVEGQEWKSTGVRLVSKLRVRPSRNAPDRAARVQPSVPEGWREVPFAETAPEPELTPEERTLGFMLFRRDATEPVWPNTRPRPDERLRGLDAFATPGEYEPVDFAVWPARDLQNFRVRVSPLRSETAGTIPASAVDVRLATYWNIRYPSYQSKDTYRRTPELLERATVHSAPAGECSRWWLRIHVPENARAGVYTGTVTVFDDLSGKAASIPLRLRVLGFRLRSDPEKRYSAYYYSQSLPANASPAERERLERRALEEFRAMRSYGLDMIPTVYLRPGPKGWMELSRPGELDRMRKAGLRGPAPVVMDRVVRALYDSTTPDGMVGAHWNVGKMPPEAFYSRLTETVMRFERERKANGWPEFIYCPVDEVHPSAREFGVRVYAALKQAGVRTYITKDPRSADADAYAPHVDIWCSQPFALPYETAASGSPVCWSYPNHIAGEIKDPAVMRRGGRMTYGFGLWRSGYSALIPWHWRWQAGPDPFDYLRGSAVSGCGNRLDDDGSLIPAVYWECFREGMDDARYLYTLQCALLEREGSGDPGLERLIRTGHALLQEVWSSIRVRDRYLDTGFAAPEDFGAWRWRIARLTDRLHRYPSRRTVTAPSVLVQDTSARAPEEKPVVVGPDDEVFALDGADFSRWESGTAEGTAALTGRDAASGERALRFAVTVDHERDGGEGGKYPVGWPRLTTEFPEGTLDLFRFDFLAFSLRARTSRSGDADRHIPFSINARAYTPGAAADLSLDAGGHDGKWAQYRIPVADLIGRSAFPEAWESTRTLQFGLAESRFPHGARITLDLADIALVRCASPRLHQLRAPRHLIAGQPCVLSFDLLGAGTVSPGSHSVRATLFDRTGKPVSETSGDLASTRRLALDTGRIGRGMHRLDIDVLDSSGRRVFQEKREMLAVGGW